MYPKPPMVVGWREWIALPDLGVVRLRAKTDTGAKTSALHAEEVEEFQIDGRPMVRFRVRPMPEEPHVSIDAIAPLIDVRPVRSSDGDVQRRPVIRTSLYIAGVLRTIEVSLARRDLMGFRMLVGREALRGFFVDPDASYLGGDLTASDAKVTGGSSNDGSNEL